MIDLMQRTELTLAAYPKPSTVPLPQQPRPCGSLLC